MIELFFIHGVAKGKSFSFDSDEVSIGRSPQNDLQIDEKSVSRRHAKITKKENKYFIQDLKSTNGTFLKNKPIQTQKEIFTPEGIPIAIGNLLFSLAKPYSGDISDIQDWVDFSKDLIETGKILRGNRLFGIKENMDLLFKVVEIIRQETDVLQSLDKILECILDHLRKVERGVIILIDDETKEFLDVISSGKLSSEDTVNMYSRTIVNRAIQERASIMMTDATREDEVGLSESIKLMKIKSVMCVPLICSNRIHGVIYVDCTNRPFKFETDDLVLFNALSVPVALAIENAKFRETVN